MESLRVGTKRRQTSLTNAYSVNLWTELATIGAHRSSSLTHGLMTLIGRLWLIDGCSLNTYQTSMWTISIRITWTTRSGRTRRPSSRVSRSCAEIASSSYSRATTSTRMMSQLRLNLHTISLPKSCCQARQRLKWHTQQRTTTSNCQWWSPRAKSNGAGQSLSKERSRRSSEQQMLSRGTLSILLIDALCILDLA